MKPHALDLQIARLAALGDPVRRSLYLYVANRQREVGRDEAARAVGVSRTLAGFHLDRLAGEGLLATSFRRLSGRSGPGAGRPAKLYHRSDRQFEVSLPPRDYEFAARILATAIDASGAPATQHALKKTARRIGQQIGAEARARAGKRPGRKRLVESTVATLAAQGYEPEAGSGELRLRNCPFHGLVSEHKALVCGMNLALIEGMVDGVDLPGAKAVLAPAPGRCCVTLRLKAR